MSCTRQHCKEHLWVLRSTAQSRLLFLQLAQYKSFRNKGVWVICQKQMSIYFVIHTQGSRLQKSQRGADSQPTTFFLSSCSHIVTKAREEVSHRAAVPLTRGLWGGWGVRGSTIYTNKLTCTHTKHTQHTHYALAASHKYPTRCNFPPQATTPLSFPLRLQSSCQTGAHTAAHQHPSAQPPVCPMTTHSVLCSQCSLYTVK